MTDKSDVPTPTQLTIEAAQQQIDKTVLSVLEEKFKGKLSGVRPVDTKDILF